MAVLQSNNTAEVLPIQCARTSIVELLDPNPAPSFLLLELNPLVALNWIPKAEITAMVEGTTRALRDFGRCDVRDVPANRERRAALILILPNRIQVGFATELPVPRMSQRRADFHLRFALCAMVALAVGAILASL